MKQTLHFRVSRANLALFIRMVMVSFLALFAYEASAQLAMTRTVYTSTYTPLTAGGGATIAATPTTDDIAFPSIPIGFTFNYLGTNYTTVAISNNGWLSFNATSTSTSFSNVDMYTTSGPNNALFPYFDDFHSGAISVTGIAPTIWHQTSGTVGSRVYTVQWTNYSTSRTIGTSGATDISFQVKLYEGTNIIEFEYGPKTTGAVSTGMNSASIGIENATGGPGNYLDALTGSSRAGHCYLSEWQWPGNRAFRFTPGAPTAISGTSFNAGVGQTYGSAWEAVSDINHRGITGPVTINLTDAANDSSTNFFPILFAPTTGTSATNTITLTKSGAPAVFSWGGVATGITGGSMFNGASVSINGSNVEPVIGIVGGDFITLDNLSINGNSGFLNSDHAIGVYNNTASDGATNNTVNNLTVVMNRANTGTRGIIQNVTTTPTSAAGANSNNTYRNLNISSVLAGIQLTGSTAFFDVNNAITTSNCNTFNTIGNSGVANDIGATGATQAFGIRATAQSGLTVNNNNIRNVSVNGAAQVDGMLLESLTGTCNINNNSIGVIRNNSTTATNAVTGLSISHFATGNASIRVYNNVISDIASSYTGAATATRSLRGIFSRGTGGATTQVLNFHNNTVHINGTAAPNASSACIEFSTASGPVYTLSNNIFANVTAAQTGVARHYILATTSATALGNTGTTSNFNNYYLPNDVGTTGFVGIGSTTNYNAIANLTASMGGIEANSLALDPQFTSAPTDLTVSQTSLNDAGAVLQSWVTADFNCQNRNDKDLGAYNITACTGQPNAGTISPQSGTICTGSTRTITASNLSFGPGISYQWEMSTTSGSGFSSVSGGSGANTGAYTTANNLAAGIYYFRLVTTCQFGTTNISNEFTLTVNQTPTISISGANSICNGSATQLTASGATTYTWTPNLYLSSNTGAQVTATPLTSITYTVTGTTSGCSASNTYAITVNPGVSANITAVPPTVCNNGSTVLTANATPIVSMVGNILISEVTLFRTGTGATSPYPSYIGASDQDFVEITNISSIALDISGVDFRDYATNSTTASHPFTFPSGTIIPANSVLVVHMGSGTNSIANRYYNTGGSTDLWSSGSTVGIVLSIGGVVIDAVGCGSGYTFASGTGVTASDWTGFAPSASGLAGTIRTSNIDNNTGSNWAASSASLLQTIGTVNAGFPPNNNTPTYTYAWTGNNLSSMNTQSTTASSITGSQVYSVVVSSGVCSTTANITLSADPLSCANNFTLGSPRCANTNFTITQTITGGGAPYTYAWTDGIGTTYPNANVITVNLPAGQYTFTCVVTDNCGASCTTTQLVTIAPYPVLTINPSPSNAAICGTGSVTLTASGASTLVWSPSNGLSATNGTSPVTATPSTTTVYTLTGTNASGCVTTGTQTVSVGTAGPTVTANANPNPLCPGATLNLTGTSTGGNSNYAVTSIPYQYQDTSGQTFLARNGVNNFSGIYTGTDLDDGNWNGISLPFAFTYYGNTYNSVRVCTNGRIDFDAAPSTAFTGVAIPNTAAPNNYIGGPWMDLDLRTSGFISYVTKGVAPARKFIVTYAAPVFGGTDNDTSQIVIYEGTNIIEVHAAQFTNNVPKVYTLGVENSTGTAGTPAPGRNAANTSWGNEAWRFSQVYTYAWTGPNAFSANTLNASTNNPGNGAYNLVVSDALGCTGSASTSPVVLNTVSTSPTSINIGGIDPSTVCPGTNVTLTVQGGSLGLGAQWVWYTGSCGGTQVGTGNSIQVTINNNVTYFVRAEGTCNSSNCASVAFTVTTPATPTVAIVANMSFPINAGTFVTFTAVNPTFEGNNPNYVWYQDGIPVQSGPDTYTTSLLPNGTQIYCVMTSNYYCLASATATSNTITVTVNPTTNQTGFRPVDCGRTQLTKTPQTVSSSRNRCIIDSVTSANLYQVQFANDFGMNNLVADFTQQTLTVFFANVPGINWGGTYYGRVRARVGGVWGLWSVPCSFSFSNLPVINNIPTSKLSFRDCGRTFVQNTHRINADSVNAADEYLFRFYTDPACTQLHVSFQSKSRGLWVGGLVPGLALGQTYYVRVNLVRNSVTGPNGPICTITMQPAPPRTAAGHTLNLYPNPTTDVVQVSTDVPMESVSVLDMAGRLVMPTMAGQGANTMQLTQLSNLSQGVYMVTVRTTDGTLITQRLMITK